MLALASVAEEATAALRTSEVAAEVRQHAVAEMDALRLKVLSLSSQLHAALERETSIQTTLDTEKREHQLTTTKLSTLLRKRSIPSNANDDGPATDIGSLRQQIGSLREQLLASQKREGRLQEQLSNMVHQHETLRVLTLEGFRSHRASECPAVEAEKGAAPASSSIEIAAADAALPDNEVPTGGENAQVLSAAVREAVRLALQPLPFTHSASTDSLQLSSWRMPTNHAQPRVGMPRSLSMPPENAAKRQTLQQEIATPPAQNSAVVFGTSATAIVVADSGCVGTNESLRRNEMLTRVPSGYARGAICIEPPKRQRNLTVTSMVGLPKVQPKMKDAAQP